jgi:pyruvate dehydrogenase E2 component (dihydrolipoamide acetyltransferase)
VKTIQVLLPRLGNTVESSILVAWLRQPGDAVAEGDPICTVETDKSILEVPSTASGVLLQHLADVGDEVPVLTPIALIRVSTADGAGQGADAPYGDAAATRAISPRARTLAQQHRLDVSRIVGTGPGGRIIERDIHAALTADRSPAEDIEAESRMTPVARAMVERGGYVRPERGSGPGGRITKNDLVAAAVGTRHGASLQHDTSAQSDDYDVIALPNIRRMIAERMRGSLHSTAQLTMNAVADARALLAYRQRLKTSDQALGLSGVTINDLMMLAVAKTLPGFLDLNATFADGELRRYRQVHLGFAVDTARGLLVPVIRNASARSLRQIAAESSRLAQACQSGAISPDALSGGTFTVTNLGPFGIESFTPIVNAPQVAILGVGNVNLRPVEDEGGVVHVPHLGLSLTIDHQIVDGAPGARFLQALARNIAQIELSLAL